MQTHDTTDFRDPLKDNGNDKPNQKVESPFADSLFGKEKSKDQTDKAKTEQKDKPEEKAKEQKTLQEAAIKEQTDALRAQERLQVQALLETRAEVLKGLLTTILTSLQLRETQQPVAPLVTPAVQRISELAQAPDTVQAAFAAQLSDQALQLENIAKVNAGRSINANDALLAQTEARLFPNPVTIPAEQAARNPLAQQPLDARAQQQALAQFPSNDAISIVGRDLVKAQAYLNAGKVDEAKALLDPSKAAPSDFTDWRSNVFRADGSDPKVVLADKITALKETVAVADGKPVPTAVINSNFLSLMEASAASRRPGAQILPIEAEASRRAVLQLVSNPTVLNHILQGKPAAEIEPTVRKEIGRMANGLAEQLPYAPNSPYKVQLGKTPAPVDSSVIDKTVTDITYSQPFKAIVLPSAPGKDVPQPPTPADSVPARPTRATQPSPLDSTSLQSIDKISAPPVLPEVFASVADDNSLLAARTVAALESVQPNLALGTAAVEPGAPVSAPAEAQQFSMSTLNSLINRVSYTGESFNSFANSARVNPAGTDFAAAELRQAQFNAATLVSPASDYFNPAPILLNTNADIIVQPATTINTNLAEYPIASNSSNLSANYGSLNIPNPFEAKPAETRLTGLGSSLDGANSGVMASGGSSQTTTSNSPFMSRRSNSLSSGSLMSSSSGSLLRASGGNLSAGGPSLGASGGRSGGGMFGGGGTGLPLWHCGFLSPDRSGNIALGLNNRTIKKDEEEEDKEEEVTKEDT